MSSTCQVLLWPEDADYRQSDEEIVLFIARVRERVYRYLRGPKPAYLHPLSWVLTFQIFTISIIWYLSASQVPLLG